MGQDARINVHLCLLNCGGAQLSVAGSLRNYSCVHRRSWPYWHRIGWHTG